MHCNLRPPDVAPVLQLRGP